MKYLKSKIKNPFLTDMSVENIFISEFLPDADGDYLKVYLYGKYLSEIGEQLTPEEMGKRLGLSETKVLEAWDYWEMLQVINKRYLDGEGKLDFTVEFTSLKDQLFAKDSDPAKGSGSKGRWVEGEDPQKAFGNEAIKSLMGNIEKTLGRPLSVTELQTVISLVEDSKASPEVIMRGVTYSMEKGKSSFRYISTVVEGWIDQGLNTQAKIDDYIEEYDQRFVRYRRVMQALGLSRNPTEEERRIMDTWFEDMGYNMTRVLEACGRTAGINNPNIKYVNTVLQNWQKEASRDKRDVNQEPKVSNTVLKEYYEYLRNKADREAQERRERVYKEVPELKEIDDKMKTMGVKLAKALLGRDETAGAKLNKEMERLNEDRALCLVEHNFEIDYMDPKYLCSNCNDTGIAEMGGPCEICREKRREEAEIWQKQREKETI